MQTTPLTGFWADQLDQPGDGVEWLWQGYLAQGNVTLLTSLWKSGKTTLLSILLARLRQGGQLAGLPVARADAIVVSEESASQWRPRHQGLDLGNVYFFCRPFRSKPTFQEWFALLDTIADLHQRHGFRLLVIDTLATFLPGRNEASAAVMLEGLMPLQRLTQLGMSILLLHHPRKGETRPGQAARGSGALPAFADVIVEMDRCRHADPTDRRRKLLAYSRHGQTPHQLVIELNPEGTDYLTHGDFHADDFLQNWERLRMVLEDAQGKRTRQQLLTDWPADFPAPSDITLWRWLQRAVGMGLVQQQGAGRRTDPFRYWLADKEGKWREDPMYSLKEQIEENAREAMGRLRGGSSGERPDDTPDHGCSISS